MRIIEPGHEHISKGYYTPYQFIEKIGRTCYKSEDKITDLSAEKFVTDLVNRGHNAMIEHYWVHLTYTSDWYLLCNHMCEFMQLLGDYGDTTEFLRYMHVTVEPMGNVAYISFPIRALTVLYDKVLSLGDQFNPAMVPAEISDMFKLVYDSVPLFFKGMYFPFDTGSKFVPKFYIWDEADFLEIMCNSKNLSDDIKCREIMKHVTHTVLFTCDRGVSHELVRHRPCSFAQESTRYCNYSNAQFGNEITFIKPFFFDKNTWQYGYWKESCEEAEREYFNLIDAGASPQEARSVLPNSLKTDIIITANETEWQHIVNLRSKGTTGAPHPQMKEIMTPWYEELKEISGGRIK